MGGSNNSEEFNDSVKRYTVNDLSEIDNPKNGDMASIPDKEWIYDGDFSSVSIPTNCIATLDLKKPLPEDVLSVFLITGPGTTHTLGETEFPTVVSSVGFMPPWNSESGPASDYLSLTGIIKGKDYEYSNGQWNEVKGVSQKFIVIDEPYTMNSFVKVMGGQEGDIYEFAEQTWKLENTNSVIKFPPFFMASARNCRIILKDNANTSMEAETPSKTLNIYLDNELIWTFKHSGDTILVNNVYDDTSGFINMQPWEDPHSTDIPITGYIPSVLEKLGQRMMSTNQITVTEDNDGNWSLFDVWDFELYSKPTCLENKNGAAFIRGNEVISNIQGLSLNIRDTYDFATFSTSPSTLFIVKNDGIYYNAEKIGSLASLQPVIITAYPEASMTTQEELDAIGLTKEAIRKLVQCEATGLVYNNQDMYTRLTIESSDYSNSVGYTITFNSNIVKYHISNVSNSITVTVTPIE